MKHLLNCRSFISLMVLFSFFDNFGMKEKGNFPFCKYDHLFKVVFVGDTGVGKTQIINKFMNIPFSDYYYETIEDSYQKIINSNGKIIKLLLLDTAGQEKYRSIIKSYYKNSNLIVLVYNINNLLTFKNIPKWVDEVKEEIDEKTKFLLVGNNCDLEEGRQVTKEEAKKYAEEKNMKFIEVSAKTGEGISDDMFNFFIKDLLDDMEKEKKEEIQVKIHNKDINGINGIKNKKTSFCNEYCSCCPCL